MQPTNHLLVFAFCVLLFQLCSKLAIEYGENTGHMSSPLYLASISGIFSALLTGTESLYQLVKHLEGGERLWEEK